MSRLPVVTGEKLVRSLCRAGFRVVRQQGSHVRLTHDDGRAVTVPVHAGESIGPGLLIRILRDADISREQLVVLLD
jgi:predicted RNA binding protein YcfA (HicA-like mRNA interferase family)